MRISDWSSDVCSSDLSPGAPAADGQMVSGHRNADQRRHRPSWRDVEGRALLRRARPAQTSPGGIEAAGPLTAPRQIGLQERDRSEERRVGNAWVSTFRSGWSPDHEKTKKNHNN